MKKETQWNNKKIVQKHLASDIAYPQKRSEILRTFQSMKDMDEHDLKLLKTIPDRTYASSEEVLREIH